MSVGKDRLDDELIELARAALEQQQPGAPVAQLAAAARSELDEELMRTPLLVGVEGTDLERLALIDLACDGMLGSIERVAGGAIRVRRAETTRYRAVGEDGRIEEAAMPVGKPARKPARPALHAPEPGEDRAVALEHQLPRLARVKPAWWAIWLWPIYWFLRWRLRDQLAELARTHSLAAPAAAAPAIEPEPSRATPAQFRDRLRVLASGQGDGAGIRGILLEVASGPLPANLEVVELVDKPYVDSIDLVVEVEARDVYLDQAGERGRCIGSLGDAIARLPSLAATGRTARAAERVVEALGGISAALDTHVAGVEASFRERIETLEALRISDREALVEHQLVTMRPKVIARVTLLIEHLLAEVGSALGQLEGIWVEALTNATTTDELKAALSRTYDGSPNSLASIVTATQRLAASGVVGAVHDLHRALVEPLRDKHGLPESYFASTPAAPATVPLFARTSQWTLGERGGNWLTGLFRSFDARRSAALAKIRHGAASLRELALAEILDLEPVLHAALGDALAVELRLAIDHQIAWLEATLAREHKTIDRERSTLAPLRRMRLDANDAMQRLGERIAAVRAGREWQRLARA
ncbi:MAG: hypothetical protein WKG01_08695 [Kofleriaceae bacterium]